MAKMRLLCTEARRLARLLPWTLQLMWQSHRGATAGLTVLTVLQAFIPAVQLWITKLLVDQVVLVVNLPVDLRAGEPTQLVWMYVGVEAALMGAGILIGIVAGHTRNVLQEHLVYHVQLLTLERAAEMDLAMFESAEYYDQFTRARQHAMFGPVQLLSAVLEFAQASLTIGTISSLVILYNPWITPLLIISTIPSFIGALYYGRQRFILFNDRTPDGRRAEYFGDVLATDIYAKEVRVWGIADYLLTHIRALRGRFRRENIDLSCGQSAAGFAGGLLSTVGYYAAYLTVIVGVLATRLSLGDMMMYAAAFSRVQDLFERVLDSVVAMYETQLFSENLAIFMQFEPTVIAPAKPQPVPAVRDAIRFEHVSFTYPGTERQVLDDVTFELQAGECVALVGSNGAGKTTLVKLLLRLYDVTEGRIAADNHDLRTLDPNAWRQAVGVIFQDYARYQLSVQENIGFGNIDRLDDLAAIQAAADKASIDPALSRLPHGYQTQLGRRFAGGCELSLGQWQRVALARALLRDAPLLIMDEPTAAMDPQAEYELYQQLQQLAAGRTTLLISHRFSTVRMADRILVLENGRIIEEGNHDTLMADNGRYAQLFKLQAESYQLTPSNGHFGANGHLVDSVQPAL